MQSKAEGDSIKWQVKFSAWVVVAALVIAANDMLGGPQWSRGWILNRRFAIPMALGFGLLLIWALFLKRKFPSRMVGAVVEGGVLLLIPCFFVGYDYLLGSTPVEWYPGMLKSCFLVVAAPAVCNVVMEMLRSRRVRRAGGC